MSIITSLVHDFSLANRSRYGPLGASVQFEVILSDRFREMKLASKSKLSSQDPPVSCLQYFSNALQKICESFQSHAGVAPFQEGLLSATTVCPRILSLPPLQTPPARL
jgi:hypothetical protein